MYHPAAGLHSAGMMTPMLEDWERLGRWLQTGEWQWPKDEYPEPDYGLIETYKDFEDYLGVGSRFSPAEIPYIGGDSESHAGEPYSFQFSIEPGTARMVLLNNAKVVEGVGSWLKRWLRELRLALHSEAADRDIFERMIGGSIDGRFVDTQRLAYTFNLVQGLKPLSARQFGVKMQSWEDLVTGPSKAVLKDWMKDKLRFDFMVHLDRCVMRDELKLKDVYTPGDSGKLVLRVLSNLNSETYDPWERLVPEFGEMVPKKGIKHVPLEDQVRYACRDADLTLRHALEFDRLTKSIVESGGRWWVHPEDYDA